MVKWADAGERNRSGVIRGGADIIITLVGRTGRDYQQISVAFSGGTIAQKFHNKPRVFIGVDGEGMIPTRMCFRETDEGGYKICKNKDAAGISGVSKLKAEKVENLWKGLRASSLIGAYNLRYDDENHYWYASIGAK